MNDRPQDVCSAHCSCRSFSSQQRTTNRHFAVHVNANTNQFWPNDYAPSRYNCSKAYLFQYATYAWFPALRNLRFRSSVAVSPCFVSKVRKNSVRTKNSVAYVKNNVLRFRKFAVAVLPFIYRIAFYFSVAVAGGLELRPLRCGKLACQPISERVSRAI